MTTKTSSLNVVMWRALFSGLLALLSTASAMPSTPVVAMPAPSPLIARQNTRASMVEPISASPAVQVHTSAEPVVTPARAALSTDAPLTATCSYTQVTASAVSGQPSISGDGHRIAFWSTGAFDPSGNNNDGNIELFLADTKLNRFTQVTSSTGSILGGFNLWPSIDYSGTLLAFASDRNLTGGNPDGNFEIYVADVSTVDSTGVLTISELTTTTVGVNTTPSMSGDGTHVAFVSNRDLVPGQNPGLATQLFMATLTGTNLLSYTQMTSNTIDIVNDEPAIDNDGSAIAYVARGSEMASVYLLNTLSMLPTLIATSSAQVDVHPAINGKGSRVVFASDQDLVGSNPSHLQQLFLYDINTGLRQITSIGNNASRCSPEMSGNGLRMACVGDDQNIYLYSAASLQGSPLTQGGDNAEPTFSNDGQSIAYIDNGHVFVAMCPVADVEISKVGLPGTAVATDLLTYTLVVTNNGPGVAANVIVSDSMPFGVLLNNGMMPDQTDDNLSASGFITSGMHGVSYVSSIPALQLNTYTNTYELPDYQAAGWQNMANDVLLFHLNENTNGSPVQFLNTAIPGNWALCFQGINCPALHQPGRLMYSPTFNGVNSTIVYNDYNHLLDYGFNSDFTVMGWINPGKTQNDLGNSDDDIIEKWAGSGGYPFVIRLENSTAGTHAGQIVAARYDGYYNPLVYSNVRVDDGLWHHVAFVKRGSYLYLYVDDVLQGSAYDNTGGYLCYFFSCSTTNLSPLYFGSRGGTVNFYTGGLDEVAVFSRGLTDADIQNIYLHQSTFQPFMGYYQSRQIDALHAVPWTTLTWQPIPGLPVQVQLPDNQVSETTYLADNVNMTGNVALYHFNESSPSAVYADSSGLGNDAQASSPYPLVNSSGVFSNAIQFTSATDPSIVVNNEVNQSLHVGTSPNQLTVEAWVYLDNASADQKIAGMSQIGNGWILGIGQNQLYPEIWQQYTGARITFHAGAIPSKQWTYVAMTWYSSFISGTGHFRGYVNGQQVDEVSTCSLGYYGVDCSGIRNPPSYQKLVIGAAPWDQTSYPLRGSIDELAIYNRELTPAEILAHYQRGAARLRFQARTCATTCSTQPFIGPDGTSGSYYTPPPTGPLAHTVALNVPANRIFQYQAFFDTPDPNVIGPGVVSVTVGPPHGAANASQGQCNVVSPMQCNLGTLAQGQVATITVNTQLSNTVPAGNLINTGTVSSDADDIDPTNNVATATTLIKRNVTLSLLKLVTPTHASFGQLVTYTFMITNNGSSPASNINLSDQLPPPSQFAPQAAYGTQFSCNINYSTNYMSCSSSSLAEYASISLVLPGYAGTNAQGIVTNTASVTCSEFLTPAVASVALQIPVAVDLGVQYASTPATDAGSRLTYSLSITNSNLTTASNVVLTDTLDPNEQFDAATPLANCIPGSGNVVCSLGSLSPGAHQVVTLATTINSNATGSVTNLAQVASDDIDINPSNNTASVTTTVTQHANLSVSIGGPSSVNPGDTYLYTLNFANNGPSDAQNVYITDTLPISIVIAGLSTPPLGLQAVASTTAMLSWYTSTLPAQTSTSILLTATLLNADTPSLITNTLFITSSTPEIALANNLSVLTTTVNFVAPGGVNIPPVTCLINQPCVITATVIATNATLPITYTWHATGQADQTQKLYSLSSVVTYTFTSTGFVNISVDATNVANTGSGTSGVTVVAAELSLAKLGPASVTTDTPIQYTLIFTNSGTANAQNVVITDVLPSALTFSSVVGALPAGFSQSGPDASNTISFTAATLAADGVGRTITFTAAVTNINPPAQITNTARITSSTPEVGLLPNTSRWSTNVIPVWISSVAITSPLTCSTNPACTFTAQVSPSSATLPITYTWEATSIVPGHVPSPQLVYSVTDNQALDFGSAGTQYITVTVSAYGITRTTSVTITVQ